MPLCSIQSIAMNALLTGNLLTFITAAAAMLLGSAALLRERSTLAHRVFALGLVLLGLEQVFLGLSMVTESPFQSLAWQRVRITVASFLPATWLLFSLSFARANYQRRLERWKYLVGGLYLLLPALILFFEADFFTDIVVPERGTWYLILGSSGYLFHIVWLIAATFIVADLERTLRGAVGRVRWQIKFTVIGVGAILASRIYTSSQAVLFSTWNSQLASVNTLALLGSLVLIAIGLRRGSVLRFEIYPSETVLYRSITVIAVGLYLLAVGLLTELIRYLQVTPSIPLQTVFFFTAIVVLVLVLMSDRVRQDIRRFIHRHFQRPSYDYRKVWSTFTRRTTSIVEEPALCRVAVSIVAETLESLSASIWRIESGGESIELAASTALSTDDVERVDPDGSLRRQVYARALAQPGILDLSDKVNGDGLRQEATTLFGRYLLVLSSQDESLGLISLGDRIRGRPLSFEDQELLQVFADQTAAALQNLKLSRRLQQAREMEAFQNMSAFFIHDLKNLASRLSLTVQNLPVHFDKPEFREEALGVISQSVDKIKEICMRLTLLKQKVELHPRAVDLNEIVKSVVEEFKGNWKGELLEDLAQMPAVRLDPEQIQKVIVNLILNAVEASGDQGKILVQTSSCDGRVIVEVEDNGCGMSPEFVQKQLFHPFRTTKKQGMGIGLFHSKVIVEEHGGRIEVETEPGEGTTFRVVLPSGS